MSVLLNECLFFTFGIMTVSSLQMSIPQEVLKTTRQKQSWLGAPLEFSWEDGGKAEEKPTMLTIIEPNCAKHS